MKKIDQTVLETTRYIGLCTLVLSALMQAVFLVLGRWNITVLLGNALGGGVAVLNFFLMGLTVQKAVVLEEKEAKSAMKVSQLYRNLMLIVTAVVGIAVSIFNSIAVIVPLFFPRIAISLSGILKGKEENN
ncbi:MAG: hypothetical protein IJP16_02795 [Clostridia bacterium]|nr:hypothetical protein [Clostridia bacterium]